MHAETRDLNDILPALGENAADFPVKLENGAAIFDGTVTGNLENPHFAGHLNVTRFSYERRIFDSLQADASASSASVEARNAALTQGTLRAQFQGSIGLSQWKIEESSSIAVSGTIRNADVTALAALLRSEGRGRHRDPLGDCPGFRHGRRSAGRRRSGNSQGQLPGRAVRCSSPGT